MSVWSVEPVGVSRIVGLAGDAADQISVALGGTGGGSGLGAATENLHVSSQSGVVCGAVGRVLAVQQGAALQVLARISSVTGGTGLACQSISDGHQEMASAIQAGMTQAFPAGSLDMFLVRDSDG